MKVASAHLPEATKRPPVHMHPERGMTQALARFAHAGRARHGPTIHSHRKVRLDRVKERADHAY